MEIWKDIEGYEGIYKVSNMGKVKSLDRIDSNGRARKGIILKQGNRSKNRAYKVVHLSKNNVTKSVLVHRIVALAFVDLIKGKDIVNHLDNDPSNNEASNLEWTTYKGNMQHSSNQGRMHYKPENLKKAQESRKRPVVATKGKEVLTFSSASEAELVGFNHRHIANCCNKKYGYKTHKGYSWRYE